MDLLEDEWCLNSERLAKQGLTSFLFMYIPVGGMQLTSWDTTIAKCENAE